jgi:multidrug resistance efflux pump
MLNISPNHVSPKIDKNEFPTLKKVEEKQGKKVLLRIVTVALIIGLIMMFLPWTQNIRASGDVTTLRPDERPQTIPSVIAGRIEKWYVQEGDFVQKGDTIIFISEIKGEYWDPDLLSRTKDRRDFKAQTVKSYEEKIGALESQAKALSEQRVLKLQQARIKLQQAQLKAERDSISNRAAEIAVKTADLQYKRFEELYKEGLKSLTDLENRNLKWQEAQAKGIAAKNKWLASKNDLIDAKVELSSINAKFDTDLAKISSDKFTAMSNKYDSEGLVTKLDNEYSNYSRRNSFYYITAPQSGYITQGIQNGIGETVKEGQALVSIMPERYHLAVELYVDPIDLPLLDIGQEVRIIFDGWPAIVFSGWPNASTGTYGGKVYAIDRFIGANGKYRILAQPDPNDVPWPDALRFGGGTSNLILLKDVPIWYELWRKINGFPPDFYRGNVSTESAKKK